MKCCDSSAHVAGPIESTLAAILSIVLLPETSRWLDSLEMYRPRRCLRSDNHFRLFRLFIPKRKKEYTAKWSEYKKHRRFWFRLLCRASEFHHRMHYRRTHIPIISCHHLLYNSRLISSWNIILSVSFLMFLVRSSRVDGVHPTIDARSGLLRTRSETIQGSLKFQYTHIPSVACDIVILFVSPSRNW